MALFFERMPQCAQKVFDTADIVREGMLRQPRTVRSFCSIVPAAGPQLC